MHFFNSFYKRNEKNDPKKLEPLLLNHKIHECSHMFDMPTRRMFYLGHKQGAGVNDVYEVSQTTKEWTLQKRVKQD